MSRATTPTSERPVAAHCCTPYLFATGSWIYSQLQHLRQHRAIVLTDRTENLDVFPFEEVYAYNEIHPVRQAYHCLRRRRLSGGRDQFFESVMRRRGARLIHCHVGYVGWEMLEVKRRLGVPMVTSFYGADASRLPREAVWRARYDELFEHGELFLAEGEAMRATLAELGCPKERIVVQHLGVAVDAFPFVARRPDGVVRVLMAATFREKKGIPDALRAIERLRSHHDRLRVTLIGDSMGAPGDEEEKRTILDLVRRLEGILRRWSYEGETVLPDEPEPYYRVSVRCGFATPEEFREALAEWRKAIRDVYQEVFGE